MNDHERIFHEHVSVCNRCPHRQRTCGGPCPCTIDGQDISDHANSGQCPKGYFSGEPLPQPIRKPGFDFPAAWSAIHALCFEPDLSAVRGKFHAIIGTLPCGDCKNGAMKYERDNPIDVSSALAVARYTWNFQNHVNAKLGKPQLPWRDAARERGWDKLEARELCC